MDRIQEDDYQTVEEMEIERHSVIDEGPYATIPELAAGGEYATADEMSNTGKADFSNYCFAAI